MSMEQKGNTMNEPVYTRSGKLLNRPIFDEERDLLVSEAPDGTPLWKKKEKLNEGDRKRNTLNETNIRDIRN